MNDLERFQAVCRGEEPDYMPIFSFSGAPGMGRGCMKKTHDHLVATGMPAEIGGVWDMSDGEARVESWQKYWGTTGPAVCGVSLGRGAQGFKETRRVEGEFEIIESESGAVTRQVTDNDSTYSMPEFITFPVRDRESWEFYRQRTTPAKWLSVADVEEKCKPYDGDRDRPLAMGIGGTWGGLRSLMGPERACTILYDDPELAHDIIEHRRRTAREHTYPLVERLRPNILQMWEDCCYNHGCLISPKHFDEFCAPFYRDAGQLRQDVGADMLTVDCDGNVMELVGWLEACGVNSLYPCEVKAGNDLFELREKYPEFILLGWLEKECVNEGNEAMIEPEIMGKVPPLMAKGRYFPNGDHGLQPPVTFDNLRRFMTLLHEVCGNPEGEFERVTDL
jgi:uroporphyrinogen decarboxylase-like protein